MSTALCDISSGTRWLISYHTHIYSNECTWAKSGFYLLLWKILWNRKDNAKLVYIYFIQVVSAYKYGIVIFE